jgi:hypothetical protein
MFEKPFFPLVSVLSCWFQHGEGSDARRWKVHPTRGETVLPFRGLWMRFVMGDSEKQAMPCWWETGNCYIATAVDEYAGCVCAVIALSSVSSLPRSGDVELAGGARRCSHCF